MSPQDWLDISLFNLNGWSPTLGQFILLGFIFAMSAIAYRWLVRMAIRSDFLRRDTSSDDRRKVVRDARITVLLIWIWSVLVFLDLDLMLFKGRNLDIYISTLVLGVLILFIARFLDLIINKVIVYNMYVNRDHQGPTQRIPQQDERLVAGRIVQYIVYVFAILVLLNTLQLDYTLFSFQKEDYTFNFKVSNIFKVILIIMLARLIIWVIIQIVLYGYYRQNDINIGSQYAINQLLKYILYFFAIMLALESTGIEMTLLWGGTAALLVGVGLGLQNTFNDFVSGVILLFERTVEVGDEVAFDDTVGTVKRIGPRSSIVESRDSTTLVVPNSQLVNNTVVNWSHYYRMARFNVELGVQYGVDTRLVKELLLQSVIENDHVLDYPSPFVRFEKFGDSALIFKLYFFSRELQIIEDVKSEIRLSIDDLFRQNDIKIPFPQREIWMNKGE